MKAPIKTFACSAIISIIFFACGETDNNSQEQCRISQISSSSSIWEKPVMDSRVKTYERDAFRGFGQPPDDEEWGYSLGNYNGTGITIITNKEMLMSAFPHIFDNEQTECNYFAILFGYSSGHHDYWVLSQDMVLHHITPASLAGCAVVAAPDVDAMLVCDDTAEGNLKDRIDIDSIRSQADPNWRCSGYAEVHVNCK